MKYKVGDKVRIVDVPGSLDGWNLEGRMDYLKGSIQTIKTVEPPEYYAVPGNGDERVWFIKEQDIVGLAEETPISKGVVGHGKLGLLRGEIRRLEKEYKEKSERLGYRLSLIEKGNVFGRKNESGDLFLCKLIEVINREECVVKVRQEDDGREYILDTLELTVINELGREVW